MIGLLFLSLLLLLISILLQEMAKIMLEKGENDTIDSGPLFTAFGVNKRGRTCCMNSVVSRRAILASSFATHLLKEIHDDRDELKQAMESLYQDNADLKEQIRELVEGMKNRKYDAHSKGQSSSNVPSETGGTRDDSTGPSNTLPNEIPCDIYSHNGFIVGHGIKNPRGSVLTMNGHPLKSNEARVLVKRINDHLYPVWGGEQYGNRTLRDVGIWSFIYWLDDLLVPRHD